MNTEYELFGKLHEQEENNEHRRQESLRLSAVSYLICPSCGNSDKYVKYYNEDMICQGCGYDLRQIHT